MLRPKRWKQVPINEKFDGDTASIGENACSVGVGQFFKIVDFLGIKLISDLIIWIFSGVLL
jgi:hypothetical protein